MPLVSLSGFVSPNITVLFLAIIICIFSFANAISCSVTSDAFQEAPLNMTVSSLRLHFSTDSVPFDHLSYQLPLDIGNVLYRGVELRYRICVSSFALNEFPVDPDRDVALVPSEESEIVKYYVANVIFLEPFSNQEADKDSALYLSTTFLKYTTPPDYSATGSSPFKSTVTGQHLNPLRTEITQSFIVRKCKAALAYVLLDLPCADDSKPNSSLPPGSYSMNETSGAYSTTAILTAFAIIVFSAIVTSTFLYFANKYTVESRVQNQHKISSFMAQSPGEYVRQKASISSFHRGK